MDDAREQLQPVIDPRETILWSGRPDTSVWFTAADVLLIPSGIFFLGFSVFWVAAASQGTTSLFPLFGLPFVVVGLYYVFGRFFVKSALKRRTAYAITNRRAIVVVGRLRVYEAPLPGGSLVMKLSRHSSHISVTFNGSAETPSFFFFQGRRVLPNTGFDPFDFEHRLPVAFYDVADVNGLKAALARVSAENVDKR